MNAPPDRNARPTDFVRTYALAAVARRFSYPGDLADLDILLHLILPNTRWADRLCCWNDVIQPAAEVHAYAGLLGPDDDSYGELLAVCGMAVEADSDAAREAQHGAGRR